MIKYIALIIIFATSLNAQTDWKRWEIKKVGYTKTSNKLPDYVPEKSDVFSFVIYNAKRVYKATFSDLDGDNCPYYPSCSNFYAEAVRKGGIFKGTLMFFDRFTRDTNLFKDRNKYFVVNGEKLYDPVDNYLLKPEKIIFDYPEPNKEK